MPDVHQQYLELHHEVALDPVLSIIVGTGVHMTVPKPDPISSSISVSQQTLSLELGLALYIFLGDNQIW